MRYVCASVAALMALTAFAPSGVLGQSAPAGLSIGNYHLVGQERATLTKWWLTYTADLTDNGAALTSATASLTSLVSSVTVEPGQGMLQFGAVTPGGHVTSSNTFTILVDRSVPFDFANLQWAFFAPLANAGPNQTAAVGSTVNLNGTGSTNPGGSGTLTYSWSFASRPSGSNAALANANTPWASFSPDVAGDYVLTLTVNNGAASSSANVTVSTVNSAPIANAGPNQTVAVGSTAALNGAGSSDPDGDALTYLWSLVDVPAGSTAVLSNVRAISPTFVADQPGTYIAQLIVTDGKLNSVPSTVIISTGNTAPVANAGLGQRVVRANMVRLDG
ncbi:MAG: hypothetical protein JO022_17475, partial [Acidobacteriaceae bacterium]|nr:hypothetical protein [Acidobacteriaceae bacterium]